MMRGEPFGSNWRENSGRARLDGAKIDFFRTPTEEHGK